MPYRTHIDNRAMTLQLLFASHLSFEWEDAIPNLLAYAKTGKQRAVKMAVGYEVGCSKELWKPL